MLQGLVREVGVSNYGPKQLRKVPPCLPSPNRGCIACGPSFNLCNFPSKPLMQ